MNFARIRPTPGNLLDGLAIGVSFACLVHCLALPLLIAALPAWSVWLDLPETVHLCMLLFAAPLSLTVLLRAAKRGAGYRSLWLGLAGLAVMGLGLLAEHGVPEAVITSGGALLLATAHILNWRGRSRSAHRL